MKKITSQLSIVLIIFCMIFGVNNVSAQGKNTSEMLQAKEWVLQFPQGNEDCSSELRFTANEWITTPTINGHRFEIKNNYYLSDFKTSIFDAQKIGRAVKGKYIIVNSVGNNPESAKVIVYEIVELTDTDLKLKSSISPDLLVFKSK